MVYSQSLRQDVIVQQLVQNSYLVKCIRDVIYWLVNNVMWVKDCDLGSLRLQESFSVGKSCSVCVHGT